MTSKLLCASLLSLLLGGSAGAATLTITPDKSTYLVGETITLSVLGDAEGTSDNGIFGRLLFDGGLASYVDSVQIVLTSATGGLPWFAGALFGGDGFAEAFNQASFGTPRVPDGPLMATVTLLATAEGTLSYEWQTEGSGELRFDFFGLTNAPGGSVTIIPEPATGLLLALGLLGLGVGRSTSRRR